MELKLDCACIATTTKKIQKWQELTRGQCFLSVISTGYKLYFYQFWLMWSCSRKKTPWLNKNLQLDSSGFALTVARFESFFVYLFCLFMQRLVWWMNTLFKLQGCLWGRHSAQEREQKIQQQAWLAVKHQTSVYCILYFEL